MCSVPGVFGVLGVFVLCDSTGKCARNTGCGGVTTHQAPTVNTNVNLRKTRSKAVATKISINKKPTALTNCETV